MAMVNPFVVIIVSPWCGVRAKGEASIALLFAG
jgi:hypothetical protein